MSKSWVVDCLMPGWRYEWRARDFRRRVSDCWGFVIWAQKKHFGRVVPDYLQEYANGEEAQRAFLNFKGADDWQQVGPQSYEVGDVVLMHHAGQLHAGVVSSATHMIQLGAGGVSQLRLRPERIEGFYRHVHTR